MLPMLREGKDSVVLSKISEPLRKYDVVLYQRRNGQYVLIRAAGHFKQTQTASLVEMFLNLSASIVLVFKFGLVGVAIGTIIATAFFVVYEMIYFSRNIVFVGVWTSIKQLLIDALVSCTVVAVVYNINVFDGDLISWIVQALIATGICVAISLLVQFVFYKDYIRRVFRKLKGRIGRNA